MPYFYVWFHIGCPIFVIVQWIQRVVSFIFYLGQSKQQSSNLTMRYLSSLWKRNHIRSQPTIRVRIGKPCRMLWFLVSGFIRRRKGKYCSYATRWGKNGRQRLFLDALRLHRQDKKLRWLLDRWRCWKTFNIQIFCVKQNRFFYNNRDNLYFHRLFCSKQTQKIIPLYDWRMCISVVSL